MEAENEDTQTYFTFFFPTEWPDHKEFAFFPVT